MLSPQAPALCFVQGKAGRLRVEVAGQGGPPVVLLHGSGGDRTHWKHTLPHLAQGQRTVAFDMRGMGESDAPADGRYALEDLVEDVVAVAEALGLGPFVLVGHSFGASVVAAACRRIPERLLGALFLDGTGDVRGLPTEQLRAWRASLEPERYAASVQDWFVQLLAPATPQTRVQVLATLGRTSRAAYVGATEQLFGFEPATAIRCFLGPKALLAVRTLDSPLSLRPAVPELPCQFFDDVSHWLQLDAPERVNASLDGFLARLA